MGGDGWMGAWMDSPGLSWVPRAFKGTRGKTKGELGWVTGAEGACRGCLASFHSGVDCGVRKGLWEESRPGVINKSWIPLLIVCRWKNMGLHGRTCFYDWGWVASLGRQSAMLSSP